MSKIGSWIFSYLVFNAVLETLAERVAKKVVGHIPVKPTTNLHCAICNQPIDLTKFDSLVADTDPSGKVRITMHKNCLYGAGLDVCGKCGRIMPLGTLDIWHQCKLCTPPTEENK